MRVPPSTQFTRVFRHAYRRAAAQAADQVIGGFIKADGLPGFVPFTRTGITDHSVGLASGAIPRDVTGGFSVLLDPRGRAVGVLFRSALNVDDINFELPLKVQKAIIHAVPDKSAQFRVLR